MTSVAVVIPAFNHDRYVLRAVRSALDQTWKDLNVVVVDDGSTDQTRSVLQQISDSRLSVIQGPHRGPGWARNQGVAVSTSRWVSFLDADDYWRPSFVEACVAAVQRSGSGVYTGLDLLFPDQGFKAAPSMKTGPVKDYYRALLKLKVGATSSSYLVSRSKFEQAGGYAVGRSYAEDTEFLLRLTLVTPLYYLRDRLAVVQVGTPGGLTKSVPSAERVRGLTALLSTLDQKERLVPWTRKYYYRLFRENLKANLALHLARNGDRQRALAVILTTVPNRYNARVFWRVLKALR